MSNSFESSIFIQQILDSSDDCINVLDLDGRILFMGRGGQALLGIQNISPFLNTFWVELWEGADQQAAIEAINQAKAGNVCTFEGYRPTLSGEPKWWDSKISPIRDVEGHVEQLLCISRDITARRQSECERKQTEEKLLESEERYRAIVNQTVVGIAYSELGGKLTIVNQKYCDITGYSAEELSQLQMQEITHPDDLPHNLELYNRMATEGTPFEIEKRYIRKDGSIVWVNNTVSLIRNGEGKTQSVVAIVLDATERKQAKEISQRAAAFDSFRISLADALRPLADPIEIQAEASRILGEYLGANRVAYFEVRNDHYVVERDYVNGVDAIPGSYPMDSFGSEMLAAYRAGRAISVSDVAAEPNLSPEQKAAYATIQISAHVGIPLLKGGEFVAGLAVHMSKPRNWTADEVALAEEVAERTWAAVNRARAEAAVAADLRDTQLLRELGARLVIEGDTRTLYQEIMSAAIALTRADGGTVQILDTVAQELVLLAAQGFEQTVMEHFRRVSAKSNTPCGIALKNGQRAFINFDVPPSEDPNGSMKLHRDAGYVCAQSTPLLTRAGNPIGMVSTHWRKHHQPSDRELRFLDLLARQAADLIEQRQTAAEREQLLAREQSARAEADRVNRIKDEFLAVLSHELRSPLNPILGWSRLLQDNKLDEMQTAYALKTIERNAKLQSELIEDLLDVSRILQGKLSLTAAPVNLVFVIQAAMETVQLAADAKSIQLEVSFDADADVVSGDSTRLQQVFWNLLSNAVKFTSAGGQVNIQLERSGAFAQITVSDTGQGIAPKFLPYVFDYFRQSDATKTRKYSGLGLGLAIARHLVELHGGTIEVESPGVELGATFTVKLPLMLR